MDGKVDKAIVAELGRRLKAILEHLVRVKARVVYDDSSKRLIHLAAHLAGSGPDYIGVLRYEQEPGTTMSEKEELFERLAREKHDPSVFMVGTAYGRALASH